MGGPWGAGDPSLRSTHATLPNGHTVPEGRLPPRERVSALALWAVGAPDPAAETCPRAPWEQRGCRSQ